MTATGSLSAAIVWLAWDGPGTEGLGSLGVALGAMALGALVSGVAWIAVLVAVVRTGSTPGRSVAGTRLVVPTDDGWRALVSAVLGHLGVLGTAVAVPWFVASLTEPAPAGPVVAGLAAGVGVALWLAAVRPTPAGTTPVERVTGTVTVARRDRAVGSRPRELPLAIVVLGTTVAAAVVAGVVPDRPAYVWEDIAVARAVIVADLDGRPDARRICDGEVGDVRAMLASHLSGPCGDPDRWWLVDGPVDARELAVLVDAATDRPATVARPDGQGALVQLEDRGSGRVVAVVADPVCDRVPVGVGDWREFQALDTLEELTALAHDELSCPSGS